MQYYTLTTECIPTFTVVFPHSPLQMLNMKRRLGSQWLAPSNLYQLLCIGLNVKTSPKWIPSWTYRSFVHLNYMNLGPILMFCTTLIKVRVSSHKDKGYSQQQNFNSLCILTEQQQKRATVLAQMKSSTTLRTLPDSLGNALGTVNSCETTVAQDIPCKVLDYTAPIKSPAIVSSSCHKLSKSQLKNYCSTGTSAAEGLVSTVHTLGKHC